MSHFKINSVPDFYPLSFLQYNPSLTDALLADCNYDFDEVKGLINSAMRAPKRCQVGQYYIQAIATQHTTFLVTNLVIGADYRLTTVGSSWLIGRNSTCAISIRDLSVSRCHAVIGRNSNHKFYLSDLGSSNGTWVNLRKLTTHQRQVLHDGDLLQIGKLKAEFFLASRHQSEAIRQEATYY
jgi:hypothetical protein